jgi:hypothetical protein
MTMDAFEDVFEDETKTKLPSGINNGLFWNILTVVVLLATLGTGGTFLSIFLNPYSSHNPFPPPVQPSPMVPPSATPTARQLLPPTWTPTPTPEPTKTPTPRPTSTPLLTDTPEPFAINTPEPQETSVIGGMSFVLDQGSPSALRNLYHPERGCDWLGIGGMVVDLRGGPVHGILVELGGTLGGKPVQMLTITAPHSLTSRLDFEFEIGDKPVVSNQKLWLQLLDQAGLPLSDKVYIDTFDDCEKNLTLVYFKQVR